MLCSVAAARGTWFAGALLQDAGCGISVKSSSSLPQWSPLCGIVEPTFQTCLQTPQRNAGLVDSEGIVCVLRNGCAAADAVIAGSVTYPEDEAG